MAHRVQLSPGSQVLTWSPFSPLQPLPSLWGLEQRVSGSYFFPCDRSVSAQLCRAAARWLAMSGRLA